MYKREFLIKVFKKDSRGFGNIQVGDDISIQNINQQEIIFSFYYGSLKSAFFDFFDSHLSKITSEKEFSGYLTDGFIERYQSFMIEHVKYFKYVCDPYYLLDFDIHFIKNKKEFEISKFLVENIISNA